MELIHTTWSANNMQIIPKYWRKNSSLKNGYNELIILEYIFLSKYREISNNKLAFHLKQLL